MKRVNGLGLDGSNLSITIGKIEVPILSISYGDKLEPGTVSAMGAQQVDEVTDGTYSVDEVSISVTSVTFRTIIMPAMPQYGGGNVRVPIVVNYTHADLGDDSDLLAGCRLNNWPAAGDNSNTPFKVELKATCRQIYWTKDRKTINRLANTGTSAPSHGF